MVAVVDDCSKERKGEDERGRGDGRKKRNEDCNTLAWIPYINLDPM